MCAIYCMHFLNMTYMHTKHTHKKTHKHQHIGADQHFCTTRRPQQNSLAPSFSKELKWRLRHWRLLTCLCPIRFSCVFECVCTSTKISRDQAVASSLFTCRHKGSSLLCTLAFWVLILTLLLSLAHTTYPRSLTHIHTCPHEFAITATQRRRAYLGRNTGPHNDTRRDIWRYHDSLAHFFTVVSLPSRSVYTQTFNCTKTFAHAHAHEYTD